MRPHAPVQKVRLPETRSRIAQWGSVYASVLHGRANIFFHGFGHWNVRGLDMRSLVKEKTGVPGFIALGNAHRYGFSKDDVARVKRATRATERDEVVLISAPFRRAQRAFSMIADELARA